MSTPLRVSRPWQLTGHSPHTSEPLGHQERLYSNDTDGARACHPHDDADSPTRTMMPNLRWLRQTRERAESILAVSFVPLIASFFSPLLPSLFVLPPPSFLPRGASVHPSLRLVFLVLTARSAWDQFGALAAAHSAQRWIRVLTLRLWWQSASKRLPPGPVHDRSTQPVKAKIRGPLASV